MRRLAILAASAALLAVPAAAQAATPDPQNPDTCEYAYRGLTPSPKDPFVYVQTGTDILAGLAHQRGAQSWFTAENEWHSTAWYTHAWLLLPKWFNFADPEHEKYQEHWLLKCGYDSSRTLRVYVDHQVPFVWEP